MVDGSGTIDPANLSNSGTFCASLFLVACPLFSRSFCASSAFVPISVATQLHATPRHRSDVVGRRPFRQSSFVHPVLLPSLQTDVPPSLRHAGTFPCWTKSSWCQA